VPYNESCPENPETGNSYRGGSALGAEAPPPSKILLCAR